MSIIEALDSFYQDAKRPTCSDKGNCILKLDGYNNYIILKGELVCEDPEEICDCLVFINETVEELFIAIVEFKSNHVHVDKVIRQIENGSKKALLLLKDCSKICTGEELKCINRKKFCHVAVARRWDSTSIRMLREKTIRINGHPYYIHHKECGALLSSIH